MRLTTVFNKVFALQGAWVREVEFASGVIRARVQARARLHQCPECGYRTRAAYDHRDCQWRHVALGKWQVQVQARLARLECPRHGVRLERVAWAEPGSRFTRAFEDLAAWLAREMSISAVTRLLKVSWSAVGRMIKRVVERHIDADELDNLEAIGVDEVTYKKGHNYVTVVIDHATGRPVWMGEGKSKDTLKRFFDLLSEEQKQRIRVVSMDMGAAYYEQTRASLPHAQICFDPFHVVQLANEACSEVRRTEARERKGTPHADVLKGARWTLLRAPENLREYEHVRLAEVSKLNKRAYRGYLLKEELRALYTCSPLNAAPHLKAWMVWAARSRLEPFKKLKRTLARYAEGILNAIRLGANNGRLEGLNTRIAVVRRRAFGFHSSTAFIAMIRLCCTNLPLILPI